MIPQAAASRERNQTRIKSLAAWKAGLPTRGAAARALLQTGLQLSRVVSAYEQACHDLRLESIPVETVAVQIASLNDELERFARTIQDVLVARRFAK